MVAGFESDLIRAHTREGMQNAKDKLREKQFAQEKTSRLPPPLSQYTSAEIT
ncbi:hypothetical protein [Glutamicibacter sp. MCAF14]|uniref:hypothetical protein n=1 Tax=Glutamicibacter sp. MCAF14 TaxID=3233043 RepID=UPI003F8F484F